MLLLHGHYKFFPRRAAVRNDWCTVCQVPRLALGTRSWVVLHLFYVPLLPVARVTDWNCSACGNYPGARLATPRSWLRTVFIFAGFLAAVAVWLLVATLVTGRDPLAQGDGRMSDGFVGAATFLMVAGVVAWQALRQQRRAEAPGAVETKAPVAPLSGDRCPLCGDLMLTRANPRCGRCRVDILTD